MCRGTGVDGCSVDSQYDLGIEQGEQRLKVTAARGGEEGIDDFPLPADIRIGR